MDRSYRESQQRFGREEQTRMAHPLDVGQDSSTVLQARLCVLKTSTLGLQQLTYEAADPARLAKDEEDLQQ
jgi:hypothetical protein